MAKDPYRKRCKNCGRMITKLWDCGDGEDWRHDDMLLHCAPGSPHVATPTDTD